jgi:hypothetical protein
MTQPEKKPPTEAQKKAADFLTRPKPGFTDWRKAREEERVQAFAAALKKAEPGDVMPDGTVYAGICAWTNEHIFTLPQDVSLSMNFNSAAKYARELDAHGHQDWHVPSIEELQLLFHAKYRGALKGTFNTTGKVGSVCYWSTTAMNAHGTIVKLMRFSDGLSGWSSGGHDTPNCRPVRTVPVSQLKP